MFWIYSLAGEMIVWHFVWFHLHGMFYFLLFNWLLCPPLILPLCPPFSLANIPLTPETARDQERRIRREIANSNERRRMQSINAGFQSLKTLIPHSDGEKLSKVGHEKRFESGDELDVAVRVWTHLHNKPFFFFSFPQAAILQQTAEYIFTLEQEKTRLLQQNSQLKRIIQVNRHRVQPETARKALARLFSLSVSSVFVFV